MKLRKLRQVSYKVLQNEDIIKLDCPALNKQFAARNYQPKFYVSYLMMHQNI